MVLSPMRYAAAIFDFDGTLVDTGDLNVRAIHAVLTANGLPDVPLDWLHTAPLADLTLLRVRLHHDLGARLDCTDSEIVRAAREFWLAHAAHAMPIPEITARARTAAAEGLVAVASANDGSIVRAGLAVAGLTEVITTVVAREDVTRLKPAPEAYLLAARRLGVRADRCLAYENTDDGVAAARAAGMDVIDVRTTEPPSRSKRP